MSPVSLVFHTIVTVRLISKICVAQQPQRSLQLYQLYPWHLYNTYQQNIQGCGLFRTIMSEMPCQWFNERGCLKYLFNFLNFKKRWIREGIKFYLSGLSRNFFKDGFQFKAVALARSKTKLCPFSQIVVVHNHASPTWAWKKTGLVRTSLKNAVFWLCYLSQRVVGGWLGGSKNCCYMLL